MYRILITTILALALLSGRAGDRNLRDGRGWPAPAGVLRDTSRAAGRPLPQRRARDSLCVQANARGGVAAGGDGIPLRELRPHGGPRHRPATTGCHFLLYLPDASGNLEFVELEYLESTRREASRTGTI